MSTPNRPPLNGPTAIVGVALIGFLAFALWLACNGLVEVLG